MIEVGEEAGIALVGLAATIGAGLFWLGHLRAEVGRAIEEFSSLREDVASLKVQVGLLSGAQVRKAAPLEDLKHVAGEPGEGARRGP